MINIINSYTLEKCSVIHVRMTMASKTILSLDIYVVDRILKNLSSLKDKVNFSLAHPYLSESFVYHSRNEFTNITFNDLSQTERSFILKFCGSTVLSLKDESSIYSSYDSTAEMMELAGKYCPSIEHLKIVASIANLKTIQNNLINLKKLQSIDLRRKGKYNEIESENITKIFVELPNLRTIELDNLNWAPRDLIPLNNLTNLEHLSYWDITAVDIKIMPDMWKNLKSLSTGTDIETINGLAKCCVFLERLEIRGYCDYKRAGFGYFPQLKHLQVLSLDVENGHGMYFKYLHGKYNKQLEFLSLPCGSIYTANEARRLARLQALKELSLLKIGSRCIRYIARMPLEKLTLSRLKRNNFLLLVRECKTLRWLHIDWSSDLDRDFFNELLNILKSNGVDMDAPFILSIYRFQTSIDNTIVDELASHPFSKLLEIRLVNYYFEKRY